MLHSRTNKKPFDYWSVQWIELLSLSLFLSLSFSSLPPWQWPYLEQGSLQMLTLRLPGRGYLGLMWALNPMTVQVSLKDNRRKHKVLWTQKQRVEWLVYKPRQTRNLLAANRFYDRNMEQTLPRPSTRIQTCHHLNWDFPVFKTVRIHCWCLKPTSFWWIGSHRKLGQPIWELMQIPRVFMHTASLGFVFLSSSSPIPFFPS